MTTETQAVDSQEIIRLASRFIELANTMKNEGLEPQVVSTVLMVATGIYATYTAAGNQGYLQPSGVEKIAEAFKRNLANLQNIKKDLVASSKAAS